MGQKIIHNGENTFFHFAGILTAANKHYLFFQIQYNEHFRMDTIQLRLGIHIGHAQHREAFRVSRHLFVADEQITHKKLMPGQLIDKMHRQTIARVRSCVNIRHIHFMGGSIGQHFLIQTLKGFLATGLIVVPTKLIMSQLVIHKKFILGRTTCMLARYSTQGTISSQHTFMIVQSLLHQLFSRQIKHRQLHCCINFLP